MSEYVVIALIAFLGGFIGSWFSKYRIKITRKPKYKSPYQVDIWRDREGQ